MSSLRDDVNQAAASCHTAFLSVSDSKSRLTHYKQLPGPVQDHIDQLQQLYGRLALAPFYQTLLRLLSEDAERLFAHSKHNLTEEIAGLRRQSLQRIRTQYGPNSCVDVGLDIYLKDIAICSGTLFPAGSRVVEISPGFPRQLMFRAGLPQTCRFVRLLSQMGGNGPCYQLHVHLSELEEFDPPGWRRTLVRLGDMLDLNSDIRGVFASAWFYDPSLSNISPNLAYLRKTAIETGGRAFFWGPDKSNNAFARSNKRKRMFDRGEYKPRVYYLIWPRQCLIEAARHK